MEKNENGYSDFNFSTKPRLNCRGERNETENAQSAEMGECSSKSLAMVYSPYQCFRMTYSPEDALKHGTLFEELYKPLTEVK